MLGPRVTCCNTQATHDSCRREQTIGTLAGFWQSRMFKKGIAITPNIACGALASNVKQRLRIPAGHPAVRYVPESVCAHSGAADLQAVRCLPQQE